MSLITEAMCEYGIEASGRKPGLCDGSKYHSPTPLLVYSVRLGDDTTVSLCGTCRDNLEVYVSLVGASDGSLPWHVRREFGNRIRDLGSRALDITTGEPA